jgi:predicted small metal-binding protein
MVAASRLRQGECQKVGVIVPIARDAHKEDIAMAKQIICQCGFVGRGATAADAAEVIAEHMRSDHPELVGEVTTDDLLAMAEEA